MDRTKCSRALTNACHANTRSSVNDRIHARTLHDISRLHRRGSGVHRRTDRQLEREWDMERALESNAAAVSLAGIGLGLSSTDDSCCCPAVAALSAPARLAGMVPAIALAAAAGPADVRRDPRRDHRAANPARRLPRAGELPGARSRERAQLGLTRART